MEGGGGVCSTGVEDACFGNDCGIGGIEWSAHLDWHVPSAGAQIDHGAGSQGIQSTGGTVELVERSKGGFEFWGAIAPPSLCCLFVGLPPAALRERLRRASFRMGVVRVRTEVTEL